MTRLDRRAFLKSAATGAGLAALAPLTSQADALVNLATPSLGAGTVGARSKVNHVVVLMQENRSVDHFLGWRAAEVVAPKNRGRAKRNRLAGFDGTQSRSYVSEDGATVGTEDWGLDGRNDYAGCHHNDPGHGWSAGRVQAGDHDGGGAGGEPDGWLKDGSGNDDFAVSFYQPDDIPVTASLVRQFTTFDRYFCSVLGPTYPNREYMHSGQSGGLKDNSFPPEVGKPTGFDWPTIWTTLELKGVTWAYYFSNLPVLMLWGNRHAHNVRHISNFYADAAAGRLPQVCFVDPFFVAPEGLANDDHPHADIRLGQELIGDVASAVIESPHWSDRERSVALFVTYDEWGGFWDHVVPPRVADPRGSADPAEDFGQLGFRVPTQLISPYAPAGATSHGVFDHTSILKFIETNFGLVSIQSLDPNARDAGSRNIGEAFDFTNFDPERGLEGDYRAPPEARVPCELRGHEAPASDLLVLRDMGWFDKLGVRTDWRFEDSYRR